MVRRITVWDEMQRMQEQMDSLFERFFSRDSFPLQLESGSQVPMVGSDTNYGNWVSPYKDVGKELLTEINLPGVDKKDIKVNVLDDGVEISIDYDVEHKSKDSYQRRYAGFRKYIGFPDGIDSSKVSAKYNNGILEIHMPKDDSVKKGRLIDIN